MEGSCFCFRDEGTEALGGWGVLGLHSCWGSLGSTPGLCNPHPVPSSLSGRWSLPHVDPLLPAGLWGAGVQEQGLGHCPHAPFRGQHPCVLCWWLSEHTPVVGSFVPGCPLWPSPVGTAALCSHLLPHLTSLFSPAWTPQLRGRHVGSRC